MLAINKENLLLLTLMTQGHPKLNNAKEGLYYKLQRRRVLERLAVKLGYLTHQDVIRDLLLDRAVDPYSLLNYKVVKEFALKSCPNGKVYHLLDDYGNIFPRTGKKELSNPLKKILIKKSLQGLRLLLDNEARELVYKDKKKKVKS